MNFVLDPKTTSSKTVHLACHNIAKLVEI